MRKEITYTTVFGKKYSDFERAIKSELDTFRENTRVYDCEGKDITGHFYSAMYEAASEKSYLFSYWDKHLMEMISMIEFANGGIYQAFVNCQYIPYMDESKELFEKDEAFTMYKTDFIYLDNAFEDISVIKTLGECNYSFVTLKELKRYITIIKNELLNIKLVVENATEIDLDDLDDFR